MVTVRPGSVCHSAIWKRRTPCARPRHEAGLLRLNRRNVAQTLPRAVVRALDAGQLHGRHGFNVLQVEHEGAQVGLLVRGGREPQHLPQLELNGPCNELVGSGVAVAVALAQKLFSLGEVQ